MPNIETNLTVSLYFNCAVLYTALTEASFDVASIFYLWCLSSAVVFVWIRAVIVMRHFEELAALVQLLVALRHMAVVVIQFVFLMVILTIAFFLAFTVLLGADHDVVGFATTWQSFLTVYQRCDCLARSCL